MSEKVEMHQARPIESPIKVAWKIATIKWLRTIEMPKAHLEGKLAVDVNN